MYPRNAASPPIIPVGAVVQISDGAVQSSGCTVSVRTSDDAETGGGGTVAYSTGNVVIYTPSQAETNHAWFYVTAYKTGCIPVGVLVVPTAAATPGTVQLQNSAGNAGVNAPANFEDMAITDTTGIVKADLQTINTTSIAGTGTQVAAAFVKLLNVAAPTGTVNSLPDAVAGAAGGVAIVGSVMGKSAATLAAADVSGNLPADVKAYTTQPTVTGATLHSDYDAAKTAAQATELAKLVSVIEVIP